MTNEQRHIVGAYRRLLAIHKEGEPVTIGRDGADILLAIIEEMDVELTKYEAMMEDANTISFDYSVLGKSCGVWRWCLRDNAEKLFADGTSVLEAYEEIKEPKRWTIPKEVTP